MSIFTNVVIIKKALNEKLLPDVSADGHAVLVVTLAGESRVEGEQHRGDLLAGPRVADHTVVILVVAQAVGGQVRGGVEPETPKNE